MNRVYLITRWILVSIVPMTALAAPPARHLSDEEFIRQLRDQPQLREGGVALLQMPDGHRTVVAIGVADMAGRKTKSLADARRESELDARVKLTGFIKGERITCLIRTSQKLALHWPSSAPASETESYEENTTSRIDGRLEGARLVGNFLDGVHHRMYAVLVMEDVAAIPSNSAIDGYPVLARMVTVRGEAENTEDVHRDVEAAMKMAMLQAQFTAGGASVDSIRQRRSDRPFRCSEEVRANGWVDSVEILEQTRDSRRTAVVIRAVVVGDPTLRGGARRDEGQSSTRDRQPDNQIRLKPKTSW